MAKDANAGGPAWSIVYYQSGFSVELMLKAIYLRRCKLDDWPDEKRGSRWHDIVILARECEIWDEVLKERKRSVPFSRNWAIVKDWKSEKRYPSSAADRQEARDVLSAVASPSQGVLQWLKAVYARV